MPTNITGRTSLGRWTRRRNIGKTTDSREKLADRGFLFSAVKIHGTKREGKTSCKFFVFHYIVRINKGFGRDFVIYYKYTENSAFLFGCRIRHPTLTILPLSMFWHIGSSCLPLLCWHIITLQSVPVLKWRRCGLWKKARTWIRIELFL